MCLRHPQMSERQLEFAYIDDVGAEFAGARVREFPCLFFVALHPDALAATPGSIGRKIAARVTCGSILHHGRADRRVEALSCGSAHTASRMAACVTTLGRG